MKDEIIASLAPLFARARAEGLWFYSTYHGLWFSPDELAGAQSEGRFVWGPPNWLLRNPEEYYVELVREAVRAAAERDNLRARIDGRR